MLELRGASFVDGLIIVIIIIAFTAIGFLLFTYLRKKDKIERERKIKHYQEIADSLLFEMLFTKDSLDKALLRYESEKQESTLFHRVFIDSLIALYESYRGSHRELLEAFYLKSNLFEFSIKKATASHWYDIIEGLRDLSYMNYRPASEIFTKNLIHHNPIVRRASIQGIVLREGIEEIVKYAESNIYFDDWTQSNIIYYAKFKRDLEPHGVEKLLMSRNETLVLLGARLAEYYGIRDLISILDTNLSHITSPGIANRIKIISEKMKRKYLPNGNN